MSFDASLFVGAVFALLVAVCLLLMLIDAFGLREIAKDVIADVLTFIRTLSVRRCVLGLGMACIALGQRLMDWAQRPQTPSGQKLNVVIREEWESRRPIEMARVRDEVVVWAGNRFLRIRR
jgi:hypothetical protein